MQRHESAPTFHFVGDFGHSIVYHEVPPHACAADSNKTIIIA